MKNLLLCSLLLSAATCTAGTPLDSIPALESVPGFIVENREIIINPVPVSMRYTGGRTDLSRGFDLSSVEAQYLDDFNGLVKSENGIPVSVRLSANNAESPIGRYTLSLNSDGAQITADSSDGVFYAVCTLREISANAQEPQSVPCVDIDDYPAFRFRGVVEGFYGTPWSHETRLSILDHMGRYKMNSYVYGPKDDPYHNVPDWRKPYPADEAAKISELCSRAGRNHVNFIWAIHPGGDIKWNREDFDFLLAKFDAMYNLGVRQFAVFFDDIQGEGTDSRKQAELLNSLNREFVRTKPDVKHLIVCPTDYSQAWAGAGENGQLAIYGRELDKDIEVFWTGAEVCSDVVRPDRDFVNTRIQRPSLTWWNFPVSDYCRESLQLGPSYTLDPTLTSADMAGILTNPMENGEASKAAMYSIADYAWNPAAYNALDSWYRSMPVQMPGAPEAYATIAIHACDPQKWYRKNESWNVDVFDCDNYTPKQYERLKQEFLKLKAAPAEILSHGGNPALAAELAPWLMQAENLADRGLLALELIKLRESGDTAAFRAAYNRLRLLNDIQQSTYMKHRIGTLRLQPFITATLQKLNPQK